MTNWEAWAYTERRSPHFDTEKPGGEDNPTVHVVRLSITKPLDADKIGNLTFDKARQIIELSPMLDEALENWGDPTDPLTLIEATRAYADTRVNILGQLNKLANDFYMGSENIRKFNEAVRMVLGYDGVISRFQDKTHWCAWFPEQIEIVAWNDNQDAE
jgi:hypothetical protein